MPPDNWLLRPPLTEPRPRPAPPEKGCCLGLGYRDRLGRGKRLPRERAGLSVRMRASLPASKVGCGGVPDDVTRAHPVAAVGFQIFVLPQKYWGDCQNSSTTCYSPMSPEEQELAGKLRRQTNQALGPGTLVDKFISFNH